MIPETGRVKRISVIVFLAAVMLFSGESSLSNREQFCAGVVLLKRNEHRFSPAQKADFFLDLCTMTGIGVTEGKEILLHFNDRPEQWAEFLEELIEKMKDTE
ncbi:MAG: hypothetical protein ACQEQV_08380 [Fibrobacterota bacterium]